MTTPSPSSGPEKQPRPHMRTGVFAIGQPSVSHEIVVGDRRQYRWNITPEDHAFRHIAGWDDLSPRVEGRHGELVLPNAARSAASVLSGMEAWPGEKKEVLDYVVNYLGQVRNTLGGLDVQLTLDNVGVDRGGHKMFVAPPHRLSNEPETLHAWANNLLTDVVAILDRDPNAQELQAGFTQQLSNVITGEGQ